MKQKSILAFSGGLDTSVVVKYLQDIHDMDVITVTVDVGQGFWYQNTGSDISWTEKKNF